MKKLTIEDLKKGIEDIENIYLNDLLALLWEKIIEAGGCPCDRCPGMDDY